MPVAKPEGVACRQYGEWLQVNWSYLPLASGDTLAGFKVKWGDGVLPAGWTVPPAVDTVLQGGDGSTPREYYTLLFRISDGLICDWESFETYTVGEATALDYHTSMWDGGAALSESYFGTMASEDFESYSPGTAGAMKGGIGWSGAAVLTVL